MPKTLFLEDSLYFLFCSPPLTRARQQGLVSHGFYLMMVASMAWWSRWGSGEAEGKSKWLKSYDGVIRGPPPNSKEIWGKWGGGHGTFKYKKINLQTDKLKGELIHIAVNPKDIWRNTCSCVCLELFKIINKRMLQSRENEEAASGSGSHSHRSTLSAIYTARGKCKPSPWALGDAVLTEGK